MTERSAICSVSQNARFNCSMPSPHTVRLTAYREPEQLKVPALEASGYRVSHTMGDLLVVHRWFITSSCCLSTHLSGRVLHGQSPKKPQNKRQSRARQKLFPDVSIQTAKQTRAHEQPGSNSENLLPSLACSNRIFQECNKGSIRVNPAEKSDKDEHLNRSRKSPSTLQWLSGTGQVPEVGRIQGTQEAPHSDVEKNDHV